MDGHTDDGPVRATQGDTAARIAELFRQLAARAGTRTSPVVVLQDEASAMRPDQGLATPINDLIRSGRKDTFAAVWTRADERLLRILDGDAGQCAIGDCGLPLVEVELEWTTPADPNITPIYGPELPHRSYRHADGSPSGPDHWCLPQPRCARCRSHNLGPDQDSSYVTSRSCLDCGHQHSADRGD